MTPTEPMDTETPTGGEPAEAQVCVFILPCLGICNTLFRLYFRALFYSYSFYSKLFSDVNTNKGSHFWVVFILNKKMVSQIIRI